MTCLRTGHFIYLLKLLSPREAMQEDPYQLIIIGGGPAGLTAGLYAARGRLRTLLVEKEGHAGQAMITDRIDNYPGFVDGISGFDLMERFAAHAERFGLEKRSATIRSLDLSGPIKTITTESGEEYQAYTVILSTGAQPRKLNIPGEAEFVGRGVSYCATCDGPLYRNQEIAVVGGGNTAIQEALHLARFAAKVTVIHRRNSLRASKILQEKAFAEAKIQFVWNSTVKEIHGDNSGVTGLLLADQEQRESHLSVVGVFLLIGVVPNNDFLPLDQLKTDEGGFIVTDTDMATNLPGVYAVGDIRGKRFRQVVNAAGEGAVAELAVEQYLNNKGFH